MLVTLIHHASYKLRLKKIVLKCERIFNYPGSQMFNKIKHTFDMQSLVEKRGKQ